MMLNSASTSDRLLKFAIRKLLDEIDCITYLTIDTSCRQILCRDRSAITKSVKRVVYNRVILTLVYKMGW